jgi:ribonuclease BN (tRNA processing enzyme)
VVAGVEEIPAAGRRLGRFQMTARIQHLHDAPTVALRLGDLITYCTDTAYDEGNAQFARGSRILAHEAWCTQGARSAQATHSTAREAAAIAADATVDNLALIHIQPGFAVKTVVQEAGSTFARLTLGEDLLAITPASEPGSLQ